MATCKSCAKCLKAKPLTEYYRSRKAEDGLQSYCKSCCKEAANEWAENNQERKKQNHAAWYERNKEEKRAAARKYYREHREQQNASSKRYYHEHKNG